MKQNIIVISVFLFCIFNVNAQEVKVVESTQSFWKVSYFNLTNALVGYEMKVLPSVSLSIEGGGGILCEFSDAYGNSFAVAPLLKSNINYYYNLNKRIQKNKKTSYNSANFLTLGTSIVPTLSYIGKENVMICKNNIVYGAWGLRRCFYDEKLTFQTELGIGRMHEYEGEYSKKGLTFILNLQLSYNF